MEGDWICLHRKVKNSDVFVNPNVWYVFSYFMIEARWKDGIYNGIPVKRGQFVARIADIAGVLKLSRDQVNRILRRLRASGAIRTSNPHGSFLLITLCGYGTYNDTKQADRTTDAQQTHSSRTAAAQQTHTYREEQGNKVTTKEGETKKAAKPPAFDPFSVDIPKELDTDAFHDAWGTWCQHRKEIGKSLKVTMVREQLRKMTEWGEPTAVATIRHTVANGWQGLRPPETNGKQHKKQGMPHI